MPKVREIFNSKFLAECMDDEFQMVAVELLAAEHPDTVRACMYQVVSAGFLPEVSDSSYTKIQEPFKTLRKMRVPDHVCVIAEKDAIAGRIAPVTERYDVAPHPLRGYASLTFAKAIADSFPEDKEIHCFYVGDHDPSGRDIERDIRKQLAELGRDDFHWNRVALEPEHFDEFGIVRLKAKKRDRRYWNFVNAYPTTGCGECDGVPAHALRTMIDGVISPHIPEGAWDPMMEVESEQKHCIADLVDQMGDAT